MPSEPAYQLDAQIGFMLRQVNQRHTAIFSKRIGGTLTPMQWAVLARLHEMGATPQTALGRAVSMDGATVKGAVDRLLHRGLVARMRDTADRRRLLVTLTTAGRALTRCNFARAHEISRETLAPLTQAERMLLARLLEKLR